MKSYVLTIFLTLGSLSSATYAGGWIDAISFNGSTLNVQGWACDPTSPNSGAQIQIMRTSFSGSNSTQMVGQGPANLPREAAVATACNSSHGNHGFNYAINIENTFLDNGAYIIEVKVLHSNTAEENLSTNVNRKFFFKNPNLVMPQNMTDIVGRDLDSVLGAPAGHIALYNSGMVWEVMNESPVAQFNTWDNFTLRTKVWNTAQKKVPSAGTVKTCFKPDTCYVEPGPVFGGSTPAPVNPSNSDTLARHEAVLWRAYQIWASPSVAYTLSWQYTPMKPTVRNKNSNALISNSVNGVYRCDSFVIDALAWSIHRAGASNNDIWNGTLSYNIEITNHAQWQTTFSSLVLRSPMVTPSSIHNSFISAPSY